MDLGGGVDALLFGLGAVGGEGGGIGEGGMGIEVDVAASEVPPVSFVGEDGADAALFADEFQENGDDGFFFSRGEVLEELGADDVDAGELEAFGMAGFEKVADIGDLAGVGVPGDMLGVTGTAEDESDEVAVLAVVIEGGLEGEIGEDIAVIDDEGIVAEEVGDVGDAAGGFEEDGFEAEIDGGIAVDIVWEGVVVFFGVMVCIDDEILDTDLEEVVEGVADEGFLEDGNEGFGEGLGEGTEACAETGAEDKCMIHEEESSDWQEACKRVWGGNPGSTGFGRRIFEMGRPRESCGAYLGGGGKCVFTRGGIPLTFYIPPNAH
jgi:hypothetical protein